MTNYHIIVDVGCVYCDSPTKNDEMLCNDCYKRFNTIHEGDDE